MNILLLDVGHARSAPQHLLDSVRFVVDKLESDGATAFRFRVIAVVCSVRVAHHAHLCQRAVRRVGCAPESWPA